MMPYHVTVIPVALSMDGKRRVVRGYYRIITSSNEKICRR